MGIIPSELAPVHSGIQHLPDDLELARGSARAEISRTGVKENQRSWGCGGGPWPKRQAGSGRVAIVVQVEMGGSERLESL